tara:strand:+ start:1570 stop:1719 length:150 start_codon:yes stop_codon:yes gene_type:complete
MQNSYSIKPAEKKSYYHININGVIVGDFEESELRHLIETFDNAIGPNIR